LFLFDKQTLQFELKQQSANFGTRQSSLMVCERSGVAEC